MNTIIKTNTLSKIIQGVAMSGFLFAAVASLPAMAEPELNLSNIATAKINQLDIDQTKPESGELDFQMSNFIAAIKNTSNQTDFSRLTVRYPETGATESDSLLPTYTMAIKRRFNKLEFTSLDRFLISLTEQDRYNLKATAFKFSTGPEFAGRDQPEISRSNLLNSKFANFFVKKLTDPFSQ